MKDFRERKAVLNLILAILIFNIISILLYFLRKSDLLADYPKIIDKILFLIIVFVLSFFISKIANLVINTSLRVKKGVERPPELLNRIVTLTIFAFALVIVLNYFNVQVTPMLAALGIMGLAIGLALQPTLSNLFAGLQILANKPVRVGDYIEVNGFEGYVEDIGWRSVRIKTLPNNLVIIPNSKLMESVIVNNYLPAKELSVLIQVGIDYGSDLKKVEKITLDVAKKIQKTIPGAVENFEPFIRYHTFADSNIEFTVILRVKEFVTKYLIKHEFIKALKERYDKEKIEISWPIRKISNMRGKGG